MKKYAVLISKAKTVISCQIFAKKAPKFLKMLLHKLFSPILQSLFGDHFLYFLAALPLLITIREENGE